MQTRSKQTLGNVIFLAGVVLSLGLALAAVWSDFEGMSYFYNGAGYDAFPGLKCPVLMSRSDIATVSATFDNSSTGEVKPYYELEISGAVSSRKLEDQLTIPGRTSRTLRWTVDANDIDLENFIFVKLTVLPVGGRSTREATCGILVLNFAGLPGPLVFWSALILSLLGLLLGLALRESGPAAGTARALNLRNGIRAVGITALLAMLTGFMGSWLIGFMFCAITVLLMIVLLRFTGA